MSTKSLGYVVLVVTLVLVGLATTVRSLTIAEILLSAVAVVLALVWINTPARRVAKSCFMPVAYKD
jgi:hypothetical protein